MVLESAFGALLTAVADPTRAGYIFKVWNRAIDGSGSTWNFASSTMPAEDIVLYAQWEKADTEDGNDNTTADKLLQTGMNIHLIAGVGILGAGLALILSNKGKIQK